MAVKAYILWFFTIYFLTLSWAQHPRIAIIERMNEQQDRIQIYNSVKVNSLAIQSGFLS